MSLRRDLLLKLRKRNLDVRRRHTFDFYLFLPTKRAAQTAAEKFRRPHYATTEVMPGAKRGTWLCLVTRTMAPDYHLVELWGALFNHYTRELGGYYDGWEIDISKP
jgi:hypothetical protein